MSTSNFWTIFLNLEWLLKHFTEGNLVFKPGDPTGIQTRQQSL